MAAFARRKGLATVQSTGKKLPFAAQAFSLVIANNVIQSFREGGPFIAEAARVLRPGGRLILSATNGRNLALAVIRRFERNKHGRLGVYSAAALRWLLREAGLTVASLLFFYFPQGRYRRSPGTPGSDFWQTASLRPSPLKRSNLDDNRDTPQFL